MSTIPIVFAFDNNLVMPACVCMSSLLMNAKEDTFYDIFILHSEKEDLDKTQLNNLTKYYSNCKITYKTVDNTFDNAYEIRGITYPAYYRLFIPKLIPEYDVIIYSDVDVIFREDLWSLYSTLNMDEAYIAGINSLAFLYDEDKKYFSSIGLNPDQIFYSGFIVFNSKLLRKDDKINDFLGHLGKKYKYQDMDILNITCQGKIREISPRYCLTTYYFESKNNNNLLNRYILKENEIEEIFSNGIVHYNGQKPWKDFCLNFDIWWEYYRKSPFYDEKFYFDFYWNKLEMFDRLPLMKRIKILARYFFIGRKK